MKIKSIQLMVVLLLGTITAYGQGTLVVDQSAGSTSIIDGVGLVIQSYSPIGQSFTPADNSIGYVALALADNTPGTGSATVYVNLLSGSITGTILSSSTPVFLPSTTGYVITDFYFPTAVSLTPGTTYYFDVSVQSGNQWLVNKYDYGYAGGSAFVSGVAEPGFDLLFQEGIVATPEPSVGWLGLLGGGAFFAWRRWQRKQC